MGVGLPLSMELMRALGGIICVESEKGNGSTFYLKLGHPCVRALIAEDDEDYALIVKNHFRDINAEIIHAVNGAEALDLFETYQPDIVIADCDMPIMDGFELTSRIKNNGGTSTPVMVMTANSDKEWETKAYAVGADHFFVKPVPENQFLEAIARFAPTPSPNLQNKSRR
jgi:CheY-like chemotaxis protein